MEYQDIVDQVIQTIRQYSTDHDTAIDEEFVFRKLPEEMAELLESLKEFKQSLYKSRINKNEKSALADEMADVLGMLIVCGNVLGIDLIQALDKKWFRHLQRIND